MPLRRIICILAAVRYCFGSVPSAKLHEGSPFYTCPGGNGQGAILARYNPITQSKISAKDCAQKVHDEGSCGPAFFVKDEGNNPVQVVPSLAICKCCNKGSADRWYEAPAYEAGSLHPDYKVFRTEEPTPVATECGIEAQVGWLALGTYRKSVGVYYPCVNNFFFMAVSAGWSLKKEVKDDSISLSNKVELWEKGGICVVAIRGSDDPMDWFHDLKQATYTGGIGKYLDGKDLNGKDYDAFDAVLQAWETSVGLAHEIAAVWVGLEKENVLSYLSSCSSVYATGHSLGGGLASLFAGLINNNADPLKIGDQFIVDKLYAFGPLAVSKRPLENDKSKDKCFSGGRYVNLHFANKKNGYNPPIIDPVEWIGTSGEHFPGNSITMAGTMNGELVHGKLRTVYMQGPAS